MPDSDLNGFGPVCGQEARAPARRATTSSIEISRSETFAAQTICPMRPYSGSGTVRAKIPLGRYMDWLFDDRTDCYSVQTTMTVGDYLLLVKPAHSARGGLSGQRDTLKTTTAKRIRDRMVSDIKRGAVLPPVVIGAVVPDNIFSRYPEPNAANVDDIIPNQYRDELAIIDGMQRTAAFSEASAEDNAVLKRKMRVEFWLTRSVRTMVYRMLVLNTGQLPWTLTRQLSVAYAPLLHEIRDTVPEIGRVFTPDQPGRRVAPGESASDALVELYISFSLRKTNVDTKEALSDEFSRLDFVENLSNPEFQDQFFLKCN